MLDEAKPQAIIIATPTHLHAGMIRAALERGIHVFCEKPLVIDPADSAVARRASPPSAGLVTQVGYHNRFVGAFREVQRLLELGAIGPVNTALAEAYGPVVLKPAGRTWRSQRSTGGGCLYDYAAHPLNLLTWYLGAPESVSGSQLTSIFSAQIDDAVASTLHYPSGTAQIIANWSDESQRKMTTKVTLWGTARPDLRRPPGDPGLPARHRPDARGLPRRLERALHDRAHRGAVVLPARRGVQRAARRIRPACDRRATSRARTTSRRRPSPTA